MVRPRSVTRCASRWSRHLEELLIRDGNGAIVQRDLEHVREEGQIVQRENRAPPRELGEAAAERLQDLQALQRGAIHGGNRTRATQTLPQKAPKAPRATAVAGDVQIAREGQPRSALR